MDAVLLQPVRTSWIFCDRDHALRVARVEARAQWHRIQMRWISICTCIRWEEPSDGIAQHAHVPQPHDARAVRCGGEQVRPPHEVHSGDAARRRERLAAASFALRAAPVARTLQAANALVRAARRTLLRRHSAASALHCTCIWPGAHVYADVSANGLDRRSGQPARTHVP